MREGASSPVILINLMDLFWLEASSQKDTILLGEGTVKHPSLLTRGEREGRERGGRERGGRGAEPTRQQQPSPEVGSASEHHLSVSVSPALLSVL